MRVRHRVAGKIRGDLVSHALRAPDGGHGVDHFERKAGAVFDAAAIGVGAPVGSVTQELVEQVAVGAMQFHAVEPRGFGVLRAGAECRDDAGKLIDFERARGHQFGPPLGGERLAFHRQGGGGDGQCAVVEIRMRYASDMPELGEDFAACPMHGVGDRAPPPDLLGRVNARGADIANPLRAHLRRLGHDQAGGGALRVIGGGKRIGHVPFKRAAARHGRHHQPVAQIEIAQAIGRKQRVRRRGRAATRRGFCNAIAS